jgi:hypothetical protein
MGKVAPNLDIKARRLAVRVAQAQGSQIYLAPNGKKAGLPPPHYSRVGNGGLVAEGGFSDLQTRDLGQAHEYTFNFALPVSNFSLHMLDYGDLNYLQSVDHLVTLVAYDVNGNEIAGARQELTYTSDPETAPDHSDYGDLWFSGDAVSAKLGEPGNWTWNISGTGIRSIVLSFPVGYDPNVAFDLLSFTLANVCQCQSSTTADFFADFSHIAVNESVEGPGKIHPNLVIDASKPNGLAVKVAQAQLPQIYLAPNGIKPEDGTGPGYLRVTNGGLVADGGFSDRTTNDTLGAHEYTFTFINGMTVSHFSLHMLDYGDLNEQAVANHRVVMVGYDANGNEIPGARQVLSYITPEDSTPYSSNKYGDLWFSGDAISAKLGQPGNWIWDISGAGIHSVVLSFPQGHDPNVAFDRLAFSAECPIP